MLGLQPLRDSLFSAASGTAIGSNDGAINTEDRKRATVILADGKTVEADDVVLAVPPSTWLWLARPSS